MDLILAIGILTFFCQTVQAGELHLPDQIKDQVNQFLSSPSEGKSMEVFFCNPFCEQAGTVTRQGFKPSPQWNFLRPLIESRDGVLRFTISDLQAVNKKLTILAQQAQLEFHALARKKGTSKDATDEISSQSDIEKTPIPVLADSPVNTPPSKPSGEAKTTDKTDLAFVQEDKKNLMTQSIPVDSPSSLSSLSQRADSFPKNKPLAPPSSMHALATLPHKAPPLGLLAGIHLDGSLGKSSLITHANTDVASDAKLRPIVGGGINAGVDHLFPFLKGEYYTAIDLSFWTSFGQKATILTGQTWSTQEFRFFAENGWQKEDWKLGLLLEFKGNEFQANPNTALSFSTTYFWSSLGFAARYKKISLALLRSLFSLVEDVSSYRGTSVSSTKTEIQLSYCRGVFQVDWINFDVCGNGAFEWIQVKGSGAPTQPIFSTNPSYLYKNYKLGLQIKISGLLPI